MHDQYILKINLLVNDDIENISIQNKIEEALEDTISKLSDTLDCEITNISLQFTSLSDNANHGKCAVCGTWASDHSKYNYVTEFSNGTLIDNVWYCDTCLPKGHPNSF